MRPAAFLTASMGLLAPLVVVSGGGGHAAADTSPITLVDGVTSPVFEYADAIRETVWVTAPDLDGDGNGERIATDIAVDVAFYDHARRLAAQRSTHGVTWAPPTG